MFICVQISQQTSQESGVAGGFLSFLQLFKRCSRRWCVSLLLFTLLFLAALPGWEGVQAAPPAQIGPGCINLIEDGDFETENFQAWLIQDSLRRPAYTTEIKFSGLRSMRVGNSLEQPNIASESEVNHRSLVLPANATRLILRFRYYSRYDGSTPGDDHRRADLYYANTNQLALPLLTPDDPENSANWKMVTADITWLRGQAIQVRFRVLNDGAFGRTVMYVDDVELEYCALTPMPPTTATTWPTPTSTPWVPSTPTWPPTSAPPPQTPTFPAWTPPPGSTPLPPPPGCPDLVLNGGFERYEGWYIGEDPVPPRAARDQWHSGARSILLGHPPGGPNRTTYSSVRQLITLPENMVATQLRWWELTYTQEAPSPYTSAYEDRHDVILLTPNLTPITILSRTRTNSGVWQERAVDLTPYRGRSFYIYFNVFNNEDSLRTWMYLDDVALYACPLPPPYATPYAQAPLPVDTATPVIPTLPPPPTFTATPLPPTATETPLPPTPAILVEPATVAVQPTATTVGARVAVLTPTRAAAAATPASGVSIAPAAPAATQPAATNATSFWETGLGTVAILLAILLIIAFLVTAIARTLQGKS